MSSTGTQNTPLENMTTEYTIKTYHKFDKELKKTYQKMPQS